MRLRLLVPTLCVMALLAVSAQQPAGSRGLLLVANSNDTLHREKGPGYVSIIDPATGQRLATVANSGITGHEVIASPDGRFAYVPIFSDAGVGLPGTNGRTLDVIDLSAHKMVGSIDLGHGVRPHYAVWGKK